MQEEGAPLPSEQLATPISVRLPLGSSAGNGGFDEIAGESEGGCGSPAGNRWPRQETMALLKIRSDMDSVFQEATPKAPLWEEFDWELSLQVGRKLREEGYQRSAKKCKEKFDNVFKYYKRTKEARAGKSYRFFSQLEALRPSSSTAVPEPTAAHAPPLPILSSSVNMVNIEASTSAAAAPSQHTLFSINVPRPPPAVAAPTTIPKIAPPPTDAAHGPSSSSNTSSFSGTESEGEEEGETSRKRKRKLRGGGEEEASEGSGKMMAFFESLIHKVMDQQDKMLQRFLEAIERREQNRMIREEAWRRQEKSRLSREHELAAQERAAKASRDDAIFSFLQKLTGQKIPIPPPPQPLPITVIPAEETPTSPPPPPPPPMPPENPHMPPKETTLVPSSRTTTEPLLSSRWPKSEVHALIKLRGGMESRYQESIPKGPLWEEISAGMLRLGYNRSAKRCKEKWENINKYFKKVKESNKNRREDAKTCPYFHQLDALYRNKLPGGSSSAGTAPQTVSAADHLAIIPPSTAATMQQEDRFGFFEQGSSSVSPIKKPEDIVKKKVVEPEREKWVESCSFQFSIQCMMPIVLCGSTGQNNYFAMVR